MYNWENYDCDSFYCFALIFWFLNNNTPTKFNEAHSTVCDFFLSTLFCSVHFIPALLNNKLDHFLPSRKINHFASFRAITLNEFRAIVHTSFLLTCCFLLFLVHTTCFFFIDRDSNCTILTISHTRIHIYTYILVLKQISIPWRRKRETIKHLQKQTTRIGNKAKITIQSNVWICV